MTKEEQVAAKPLETRGVWWLNPAVAFGIPAVIAGFIAYGTDATAYFNLWRTAKYFDFSCLQMLLAVVLIFTCGCLLGGARRREANLAPAADWTQTIRWDAVRWLFRLSFILTVVAYGIWFAVGIAHGLSLSVIYDVIRGSSNATYDIRDTYLATIPGVTTATECGIAVIGLGIPLGVATGWRGVRWQCLTVIVLAFIRAFINSERLALTELLVTLVVSFTWLRPPMGRRARRLTQAAPALGLIFLYIFFAAGEYFRSWSEFYANRESSFWSFIGLRLMGYYTTALNNGALLWRARNPLSLGLTPMTLAFIGHFPILSDVARFLFPYLFSPVATSDARYAALLATSANPELTNPSGIFGPIADYGAMEGLLYWLLCGLLCGYLYKEFKLHRAAGVFLYPVLYIGLVEATRVLYWAAGRFFPAMFLLVVSVLFVVRKRRTRRVPRPLLAPKPAG